MHKFMKFIWLICCICLIVAVPADLLARNHISGGGHSKEVSVTITDLTYDSTVTDSQAISTVESVTYQVGTDSYTVDLDVATENAIFTVNGVQYDLISSYLDGTEYTCQDEDDVAITITTKGTAEEGTGCQKFFQGTTQPDTITYYTNTAAWITGDGLLSDYSASTALVGGKTGDTFSSGASVTSNGGFFSGYYIDGATYDINNLTMSLDGNGGDDFQGWGAGIVITGGANVTLTNSIIDTTGVIRTALWAGGELSTLDVSNSVISAHNRDDATPYSDEDNYAVPMMEQVPFALGLVGNLRATNVLGSATATYKNSIIASNAWAALSTDSGTQYTKALDVSNVLAGIGEVEVAQRGKQYTAKKKIKGTTYGFTIAELGERSGYVTYADAGVYDMFDNVKFYAPDYLGIIASSSSLIYMKDSYGYSDRIGFLIHQNNGSENTGFANEGTGFSSYGGLYVDGGKYDVADTFALVKGGSINGSYTTTNIEVDGADINIFGTAAQSGALLRLMNSDDAGSPGVIEYTIDDLTLEEYEAYAAESTVDDTTAVFSNMTVAGDIFNTVYQVEQALNVTLDNVTLDGVISSAFEAHVDADGNTDGVDGLTIYAANGDDYLYIGRVTSTPQPAVNNPIYLTLANSTTWNVTGTSYLSSLSWESGCTINGTVTVDGSEVTTPGDYSGSIVVTP